MRGYKQVKHIKHTGYIAHTITYSLHHTSLYTLFVNISNGIYLIIFWCTILQTLPQFYLAKFLFIPLKFLKKSKLQNNSSISL